MLLSTDSNNTNSNNNILCCNHCHSMYYGRMNGRDCYCYLSNCITLLVRNCMKQYYDSWLVCDDTSCGRRTRQQSIRGNQCTDDCHGSMIPEYNELMLHNQLSYLESLFDIHRMMMKKQIPANK